MKFNCLFIFLFSLTAFAQKEGQNFCKGTTDGSYFPLDIQKKKILWYDTYYYETLAGEKEFKGKKYKSFKQQWENSSSDIIYFREDSGTVLKYEECCTKETIRNKKTFEKEESWKNNNKESPIRYTFLSYDAKLETPYCRYENLMALKAEYEIETYVFYYLRGLGYVGATRDGKVISCIVPE